MRYLEWSGLKINNEAIDRNFAVGREGVRVNEIILHTAGAGVNSLYNWFNHPDQRYEDGRSVTVSAHMYVNTFGRVEAYVDPDHTAFSVGSPSLNRRTFNIEFDDRRSGFLYEVGAKVLTYACLRFNLGRPSSAFISGHNKYADGRVCPGDLDVERLIKGAQDSYDKFMAARRKEIKKKIEAQWHHNQSEIERLQQQAREEVEQEMEVLKDDIESLNARNVQLMDNLATKELELKELQGYGKSELNMEFAQDMTVNLINEVVVKKGLRERWGAFIDRKFSNSKRLREFFKYNLFILIGMGLSWLTLNPLFLQRFDISSELAGVIITVTGIIFKSLVAQYDTNEDGVLTEADLITD